MDLIWKVPFWCESCKKEISGLVYRDESSEPLPEEEKERALDLLKHYHKIDNHLACWKCQKHIKPHEIADLLWRQGAWRDLCRDCAEKSNRTITNR